jgi:hypothetical protein
MKEAVKLGNEFCFARKGESSGSEKEKVPGVEQSRWCSGTVKKDGWRFKQRGMRRVDDWVDVSERSDASKRLKKFSKVSDGGLAHWKRGLGTGMAVGRSVLVIELFVSGGNFSRAEYV